MYDISYYQKMAASYDRDCRQYLNDLTLRPLLEGYRAQTDPGQLEALLCVLKIQLPSLSDESRLCVLSFLYDMLSHRDGDVRRQAADLAGQLLAGFEPSVWKDYLRRMLFSNVLMPQRQRRWVGFALKYVLTSLLSRTEGRKQKDLLKALTEYYKSTQWDSLTCFFLMDCASTIPYALCNDSQRKMLLGFARFFLMSSDRELCCAALIFTDYWLEQGAGDGLNMEPYYDLFSRISREDPSPGMRILAGQVLCANSGKTGVQLTDHPELFTQLLLENRSMETPWIIKQVNLRILHRSRHSLCAGEAGSIQSGQYASCLLNMLQFSDHIVNRLQAEEDLGHLLPSLDISVRFDAGAQLIRTIETGDANMLRYVPSCLARVYTALPEENRSNLKERLARLVDSESCAVVTAALKTAAMIISAGSGETDDFLGLWCCGLSHYDLRISLYTLLMTGRLLYGSASLTPQQKQIIHAGLRNKIPCMMPEDPSLYSLLCHEAAFDAIAGFLKEALPEENEPEKIAFFPGAFDPFSLGNRAVVREITQMGFSVWLCADEFSWSRKVQPLRIRQQILAMSVADLKNAFLFPKDIQINIANPDDLRTLRQMFPGREVFLVAGSDVLENASAYKMPPQPDSVYTFPHIVFSRNMNLSYEAGEKMRRKLPPGSILLKLPSFYEHMNASGIRENVFHGKDISDLVGMRVQHYIYDHNLYTGGPAETMKKPAPMVRPVKVCFGEDVSAGVRSIEVSMSSDPVSAKLLWPAGQEMSEDRQMDIRSLIRYTADGTSARIRQVESLGRSGYNGLPAAMEELLMHCKMNGITRVLAPADGKMRELAEMFGFIPSDEYEDQLEVSLKEPVVLFSDTSCFIRDAYASAPPVRKAVHEAQMRLLKEAAKLRPGHAVLRAEAETLSYRLMKLILKENPPAADPYVTAPVGAMTVVPVGKLYRNTRLPGCVTKDLYIEKEYSEDLHDSTITHAPEYPPLPAQARTIRSLMRPVILVDDIYSLDQNGSAVCSIFTNEDVAVRKFIVGLLAGSAAVPADSDPVDLDAVYSIPDASLVLDEAELYPFIGGTCVQCQDAYAGTASVNPILPYQYPELPDDIRAGAFRQFSKICMENALAVCRALEDEYLQRNGRRLTLPGMREVFTEVRIPDSLIGSRAIENETPSELLRKELKRLGRLENLR